MCFSYEADFCRVSKNTECGPPVDERDLFVQGSPLMAPRVRVPPFISNKLTEKELRRFGTFVIGFKTVSLGWKDPH